MGVRAIIYNILSSGKSNCKRKEGVFQKTFVNGTKVNSIFTIAKYFYK